MTSEKDIGYLVFVSPPEPDKSFKHPFKKSISETQKLEEIVEAMRNENKCYFEFVDCFGRKILQHKSVEEQKIFQPFYITTMVPKICKVNIKLPSGDRVSFEVDLMDAFSSLMERIETETGYLKERQRIYLGEKILNSDQRLIDSDLHNFGGDLILDLKSVLHIKGKDQTFDIYTDLRNPAMLVHFLIETQTKIPAIQQSLVFNGKELKTDKSLEASGVQNDSFLVLEVKVRVLFSPLNGAAKAYYKPSTKVAEIKDNLNSQLVITDSIFQNEAYDFECDGRVLDEEMTLAEHNLQKEACFKIKMRKEGVCINLEEKMHNKYTVGLLRKESVGYLKSLLVDYCALNQETIKVFDQDSELDDQITFEDLETNEGKPLELKLEAKTIYLLKIKPPGESILEIKIDVTTIVLHLKNEIERKGGPPIDNQRLFFEGKGLEDHKTIKSYHLVSGAVLDLVEVQTGENGGPGLQPKHIVPAFQIEENNLKDTTPEWRYIRQPGLCVEGICEDEDCKAYNKWVIINRGLCTYDLKDGGINNDCPLCNSHVDVTKYALNNCVYSYVGISRNEKEFKKIANQNLIDIGDEYKYLDLTKILQNKDWVTFKIITKSLQNNKNKETTRDSCGICRKIVENDDKKELECAHIYHNNCLNKINHLEIPCIYCHL